jgi:thiol-disulfide isomerase/thioredoxin
MKKILCILLFVFAMQVHAQSNKGFILSGKLDGLPDAEKVYLVTAKDNLPDTVGVSITKNGNYSFKGAVPLEADWYFIKLSNQKDYVRLFLDNSRIEIHGKLSEWPKAIVKGSGAHDDYLLFSAANQPVQEEIKVLQQAIGENASGTKGADLTLKLDDAKARLQKIWLLYINQHPNSLYTPFLILRNPKYPSAERQTLYGQLTDRVKASNYGVKVKEQVLEALKSDNLKLGGEAPDFVSKTPKGESLSLKAVVGQGKLTLIDFWASWCAPCRQETPNLLKVYQAFHDKGFNILSVSFDANRKDWTDAINKDSMLWYHVSDLKFRDAEVHRIYKLNAVPAYVLLDQNGKILAMDMAGSGVAGADANLRGDDLYRKVEQLLGGSKD